MTVCHAHFQMLKDRSLSFEEVKRVKMICLDCREAQAEELARQRRDHTIDPSQPYGKHIPLVCKGCGQQYSTKNIGYIGARTVFPALGDSCSCDFGLLEVKS